MSSLCKLSRKNFKKNLPRGLSDVADQPLRLYANSWPNQVSEQIIFSFSLSKLWWLVRLSNSFLFYKIIQCYVMADSYDNYAIIICRSCGIKMATLNHIKGLIGIMLTAGLSILLTLVPLLLKGFLDCKIRVLVIILTIENP